MSKSRPRTAAARPANALLRQSGFTLIELVVIITVLGVLAAVAVPKFAGMTESSREVATQQELITLRTAIVGNPQFGSSGEIVNRGFEGDVGFPPSALSDLVVRPDSIMPYNRLTRLGWNGPYIDSGSGDYLTDAWSTAYEYNPFDRVIRSVGGSDTISVSF